MDESQHSIFNKLCNYEEKSFIIIIYSNYTYENHVVLKLSSLQLHHQLLLNGFLCTFMMQLHSKVYIIFMVIEPIVAQVCIP